MSAINKLTDKKVATLSAADKRKKVGDGGSLFLVVEPNGTKKWQMPFTFAGKQQTLSFGIYPTTTLAMARNYRDEARRMLNRGINPCVSKKVNKTTNSSEANSASTGPIFREVARQWYDKRVHMWSQKHKAEVWKSLEDVVFPHIGDKEPDSISTREILDNILEPMDKANRIEKAQRVLQRMRDVFAFARLQQHMTGANPCADLRGALKVKPKAVPRAALTDLPGIQAMLKKSEDTPCHVITRLALRFVALTAMRPGNINTAEWAEINDDVWLIPESKMKAGKPFTVPLSRQAMAVLNVLRPLTGDGRYLFPNSRNPMAPKSANAMTYHLNRSGYQGRQCAHGWRASFSSVMNLRHPGERHIIDFALAHLPKDRIEAAYNRAEYFDRRREHLQEWADLLLDGFAPPTSFLNLPQR
jgi:integrase